MSVSMFFSGDPVLVGTQVCPTFDQVRLSEGLFGEWEHHDDAEIRACYRESLRGPVSYDEDGCLSLDARGEAVWELERRACALEGAFDDDLLRFDVVDFSQVEGAFDVAIPLHPSVAAWFRIEDPASEQPGVVAEVGEPIWVVEDRAGSVRADVVFGRPPREVAVQDALLRGTVAEGTPTIHNESAGNSWLEFAAQAGDVFEVAIDLPAGSVKVGRVHVVGREAIASIELFPQTWYIEENDELYSLGAVAVVRDADGRVLREAPLEWSVVRGRAVLDTLDADEDGNPDPRPFAYVSDACAGARSGEARSATLKATLDGFEEMVDLDWHCTAGVDEGCACATTPSRDAGAATFFALLALAVRRRGRPGRALGCPAVNID